MDPSDGKDTAAGTVSVRNKLEVDVIPAPPLSSYTCTTWNRHNSCNSIATMVFLTPTKMGRAAELRRRNASYQQMATELQCSAEAVRKRLLQAAIHGNLYHRSPPGRPPLPARKARQIYLDMKRHSDRSFHAIGKDNGVSGSTARRIAASHDFYRFVMKRKPLLNQINRLKRLRWASEMENQDWTSVIFTDEALVKIGDQGRR